MSIAVAALQYLTMMVLRDATLAGSNVLDNPVNPVPDEGIDEPMIAVYIGEVRRKDVEKDGLLGTIHDVDLSIQVMLPAAMKMTIDGQEISLSTRGDGLQFVIGMIGRQIDDALVKSESEAAQAWRVLATVKETVATPWLMEISKESGGLRIPAIELLYNVETLTEPTFTADDIPPVWEQILDLMAADEDYAPIAGAMRAMVIGLDGLPTWRRAQVQLGTTEEAVAAMGLTPFLDHAATSADEAAGLTDITLDPLGITADEALPPEED